MCVLPATLLNGVICRRQTPLLTFVRTKARINIQKPRQPHWDKFKFQVLTKPRFPAPSDLLAEKDGCFHSVELRPMKEVNPLEVLVGEKVREACDNSRLIVFMHRNSVSMSDVHKAWQTLKRAGFTYHRLFNNTIARHAFQGTRLAPVLVLCRSHTALVTGPEPHVARLLRLQKKLPQFTVIGGVVEGRFMSVPELESYGRLPGVPALRAQLSHLLGSPALRLRAALTHHQTALVRSLAAHSSAASASGRAADAGATSSADSAEKAAPQADDRS